MGRAIACRVRTLFSNRFSKRSRDAPGTTAAGARADDRRSTGFWMEVEARYIASTPPTPASRLVPRRVITITGGTQDPTPATAGEPQCIRARKREVRSTATSDVPGQLRIASWPSPRVRIRTSTPAASRQHLGERLLCPRLRASVSPLPNANEQNAKCKWLRAALNLHFGHFGQCAFAQQYEGCDPCEQRSSSSSTFAPRSHAR